MNIKVIQHEPDIAGDLVFNQPKFHFGQILEDIKGRKGFVIGMEFSGEWSYTLVYCYGKHELSRSLEENEVAITTTIVATEISQLNLGF